MNPGLVIKLRPAGPWRIGPDSGARNRVDFIYHSDSLYSAITSAMGRLGSLEEWLDATARQGTSAVCFSSCFPFLDEIGFVVPPRTIWPPTSPASMSARVRWKSARFVPLGIVQAILAGQKLDGNHWAVDGASECLVPAGRLGPFRTGVRWNAAVDRLTGAVERHSTACIEFRPGSGLWTVVSFRDEAAREQWTDRVKAAFRLLADTGFGGERSRGWGRAEAPEFIEGVLPGMILPESVKEPSVEPPVQEPPVENPPMQESPEETPPSEEEIEENRMTAEGDPQLPPPDPDPVLPPPPEPELPATDPAPGPPLAPDPDMSAAVSGPDMTAAASEPAAPASTPPAPTVSGPDVPAVLAVPDVPAVGPHPQPPSPTPVFWLLSLFTPAADDAVDWARGDYTVLARGGRVESPAGSGELKKQVQMIAEGSVLYSAGAPRGAAADVAPEGFAHPVFRAGFALSIPLPNGERTQT